MAFDPTTLFPGAAGDREGAILKIRPENLWQDEAGTVAVTTDGDPVHRIDDISVNGRNFVLFTVAMTYKTNGTVHWLTSTGSAANSGVGFESADSWSFMDNSPYTVGAAVSFSTATKTDKYFFGTEPAVGGSNSSEALKNSVAHCGARTSTTATIAHWFNDQDFSHSFPTDVAERHICEYKNPGSEYTVNGAQIDASATVPSLLDNVGLATIFTRSRSPARSDIESMQGDLYGMIIVVDTVTAQEKADIDLWLQEQIEGGQIVATGLASETSSAKQVLQGGSVAAGKAAETDSATVVAHSRAVVLGQSLESAAANVVTAGHLLSPGLASEADAAGALVVTRSGAVGLAAEADAASGVTIVGGEASSGGGTRLIFRRRRRI